MKVIHFTSSLNLGGAERFVIDLAHTQRLAGNIEPVIVSYGQAEDSLSAEVERVEVPCYHLNADSKLRLVLQLQRLLKTLKPDVLHVHSPAVMKSLCFLLLLLPKRYQVIYTRHGANPYTHGHWLWLHAWFKRVTNFATFVSDDARTSFLQHHHWEPSRCITVCNGVFIPDLAERVKQQDSRLSIGLVGRLEPIKSSEQLFLALKLLPEPLQQRINVHVFGTGSQADNLKQFTAELPKVSTIFHGLVLNREAIYQQMDVQVVCSKSEGLSLAIMEGLARGVPCIATKVGGNPELIHDGENGFLYEYADVAALAQHLVHFLENNYPYHKLSNNARQRMLDDYPLTNTLHHYQQLYTAE